MDNMITNNPTFEKDSKLSKNYKVSNCNHLSLRSKPNTNSDNRIGLLARDEEVELVAKISDIWVKVKTSSGKTGFVMSEFLTNL